MNLKCLSCGKDAEFMVDGNSLCREHLPGGIKEVIKNNENTERQKKHNMR